jgi:hypothetical protein
MKGRLFAAIGATPPHDLARLKMVFATILINIAAVGLLAFAPWSDWKTGLALNLFDNILLLGVVIGRRDRFLARLLVFGLATGFAELAADAWLVDHTRTLDYSVGGGPMIWRSPLWMPIAWEIAAVQFGFLGTWLWEHFGSAGLGIIALLGATNIPYYEGMARKIHWWTYTGCRMIGPVPWYIMAGEAAIALGMAVLARPLRSGGFAKAVFFGVLGGLVIFISYGVAWYGIDGTPAK